MDSKHCLYLVVLVTLHVMQNKNPLLLRREFLNCFPQQNPLCKERQAGITYRNLPRDAS